ncbi:unnamed protein product, partial [Prorocentrum cordatum]
SRGEWGAGPAAAVTPRGARLAPGAQSTRELSLPEWSGCGVARPLGRCGVLSLPAGAAAPGLCSPPASPVPPPQPYPQAPRSAPAPAAELPPSSPALLLRSPACPCAGAVSAFVLVGAPPAAWPPLACAPGRPDGAPA